MTDYSTDDDRYPERGLRPDGIVMAITVLIALAALFGVWWTEGGL